MTITTRPILDLDPDLDHLFAKPLEASDVDKEYPADIPLVHDDGEPLETEWHVSNMLFLIEVMKWFFRERDDVVVGGNQFVYYYDKETKRRQFRGPDFYVVKGGVDRHSPRKSWVSWDENGRFPDVIVELASPTTKKVDRTTKLEIYCKKFRTRNYFIFDPFSNQLDGWELVRGRYRPLQLNEQGRLWSSELGLWLGLWDGEWNGDAGTWLRFFDNDGNIVLKPSEAAQQEAEAAQQEAEAAQQEAKAVQQEAKAAQQEAEAAQREARRAQREAVAAKREARDATHRAEQAEAELARLRALLNEPSKGNGPNKGNGRAKSLANDRPGSQRFHIFDQVRELRVRQLALVRHLFWVMRTLQQILQACRTAVVQQQRAVVDAEQRRRIVALVHVAFFAGADLVDLAVGEVRTRMAAGASRLLALEDLLAALAAASLRLPSGLPVGIGRLP